MGFSEGYWNFLEAGHGKGPADGIGAVIKRTADKLVALGKDLTSTQRLMDALVENTTVKLFIVDGEQIERMESKIPQGISAIPNTMKLHQVIGSLPLKSDEPILFLFVREYVCLSVRQSFSLSVRPHFVSIFIN